METKIHKGIHGWTGRTVIPLPAIAEDGAIEICTMKRYSGEIVTAAQYGHVGHDGRSFSYFVGQDWRKAVERSRDRATESTIRRQHERAVAQSAALVAACEAHYLAQRSEEAAQ